MNALHICLIEDEHSREDRDKFHCTEDPRRFERKDYLLNKILNYLSDRVRITSILDTEIPAKVPDEADAFVVHIDVSLQRSDVAEWLAHLSAERPVINGGAHDLTKRAVDKHRPSGFPSLMLSENDNSGWAFVKSDFNYGQAPEIVYERTQIEHLNPDLKARSDLVVQRWIEDYRAGSSGFFTLERYMYILGDLTVREVFTDDPLIKGDCFFSHVRPWRELRRDMRTLEQAGLRPGVLPAHWLDDESYWSARRSVIEHYGRVLGVEYAGIDAIQTEPGVITVLDINPTPFHTWISASMLSIMAANFLDNLSRRAQPSGITLSSATDSDGSESWEARRLARLAKEISEVIRRDRKVILVDDNSHSGEVLSGRTFVRYFADDGEYGGRPHDDQSAIEELEKLRAAGADNVVFTWPAQWWLKYFPGLHSHLRSKYTCILDNSRAVVFDLHLPN